MISRRQILNSTILNNRSKIRVLGISGSLRRGSFNSALLRATRDLAPDEVELSIFDLKDVPLYDGDVEAEGDPKAVTDLKEAIRQADGILFATPEYNGSTSGVLKNAIDWASRDRDERSLNGKPAAIIGAGGFSGTARSQAQLQPVLNETGALLMVKPGVLVTMPWEKFDAEGRLTDEDTRMFLGKHLDAFARWIARVGVPLEATIA